MGKIFITSDTHFGHDREFLWSPRGFENIFDHDETIIENWNNLVDPEDTVYHLGDIMLGDNTHGMSCLSNLNGNIKIILGNHDTNTRIKLYESLPNVEVIGYATIIKYKKYIFYLSHYPTMTSNLESSSHLREHTLNLFGHTHQKTNFYNDIPFMYHVGVDSHNNCPILIDEVIEEMHSKVQECIKFLDEDAQQEKESGIWEIEIERPLRRGERSLLPQERRCNKCIYFPVACGHSDQFNHCVQYKRDPPDGGYYG